MKKKIGFFPPPRCSARRSFPKIAQSSRARNEVELGPDLSREAKERIRDTWIYGHGFGPGWRKRAGWRTRDADRILDIGGGGGFGVAYPGARRRGGKARPLPPPVRIVAKRCGCISDAAASSLERLTRVCEPQLFMRAVNVAADRAFIGQR